jgi:hypothetical protein
MSDARSLAMRCRPAISLRRARGMRFRAEMNAIRAAVRPFPHFPPNCWPNSRAARRVPQTVARRLGGQGALPRVPAAWRARERRLRDARCLCGRGILTWVLRTWQHVRHPPPLVAALSLFVPAGRSIVAFCARWSQYCRFCAACGATRCFRIAGSHARTGWPGAVGTLTACTCGR